MKHTKEEILNALQIIKDECEDTDCCDCPFGFKDGIPYRCMLKTDAIPEEWRIKNEKDSVWRAFEE